ncbi:short-chain dehydrogenase [Suillus subalutaceus]|uniref:short-chain dehydrogenase n=1 Tax=Suillus subalutaceus TaxID=48586 RepID=UPI001B870143|nr:short-chain dehydrogenase [Suillus subalutaceus]KAG1870212.1 short-chain dehydrogenase [Suillus subalutaceus]
MGKLTIFGYLREQWTKLPISTADVSDQSLVVVGANVGLGNEAAVHLAQLKPKSLLITSRDEVKCERSKADVEIRSGMTGIESWPLELCSFDSVRSFVDHFEAKGCIANVLIANAGISTMKYTKTPDGYETTFQVNYLSTALLSLLMLPHLVKAGTPEHASRLVIVSSECHYLANRLKGADKWPSIIETINDEAYCTRSVMMNRYFLSKLLEVMFIRELSFRLPTPTLVAVSAVNPGSCHSRLTREVESNPLFKFAVRIYKGLVARTTEMGSRTLVHAAIEPGERERHGHYLSSCEVTEESDYTLSAEGREVSKRLWHETLEILGDIDPRINTIVSEHLIRDVA